MHPYHRFSIFGFLIAAGLMAFSTEMVAQVQVTLEPTKDNTLYQSAAGELSNGAGQYFFVGRSNQPTNSIRRAVLAFNIGGNIPAGATILSATLTLNMSQTVSAEHMVSLHRATADWGEGTSVAAGNEGGGAPSTTGDATWLHRFFSGTLWTAPGGDFVSTASAQIPVGVIGSYTWGSTPGMVSDVQLWLNTPTSNFGWLMRGNEELAATAKRFGSRQNVNQTVRPKLTVTYQPTLDVREPQGIPARFALHQNYPNPFNPTTNISFDVAEQSFVTLRITDILGREITTLVGENLSPGRYAYQWNAEGVGTGVYVYQLRAGEFEQSRKLILAR